MLGNGIKLSSAIFRKLQAFIWTTQCWLNSECPSEQGIDLTCHIFLQIAGRNLGSIGQLHTSANPLPKHVRVRDFGSIPFLLVKCRAILQHFSNTFLNNISRKVIF